MKTTTKTPAIVKNGKPNTARTELEVAKTGESTQGKAPSKERIVKRVGVIPVKSQHIGNIEVRVVAREGSSPRLAIMRMTVQPGGTRWYSPRLGRISRVQTRKLIRLLKEAVPFMRTATP